jgi:polyether ionophore transport system permease protein
MSAAVAGARGVPLFSRVYGFGSIYAKALRDTRLSFIVMAGLLGGLMLVGGEAFGQAYGTVESRKELASLINSMPPILSALTGNPVNVQLLGGSISWKYGPFFVLLAGLWSILAMSATLAVEARSGSLDFIAAGPFGKRRIALEKLGAYLTAMVGVMAVLTLTAWLDGIVFASLPGDPISPASAVGFALWVGLLGIVSGSVAFALAPFIGRGGAAALAGLVMVIGFLLNGYQGAVPAFQSVAWLSWFAWASQHVPLAGQFDWRSLVFVAAAAAVLMAIGVEAFARRDLGVTSSPPLPQRPSATLGLRTPAGRSFGEVLGRAVAWGFGIGLFGLVLGASSRSLADAMATVSPETLNIFKSLFPNFDITTPGGFLQLLFMGYGVVVIGFAAVMLVSSWGADESTGRLEMLLTTPMTRAGWALAGGVGTLAAIVVMTVLIAIGIGIGAAMVGGDVLTPMLGTASLGLYAAAAAGIGFAVGGLWRTSVAAEVAAGFVIATLLVDLVVPPLNLPDWIHQLALTSHFGQPMVGLWDATGVIASAVIAVGGVALGTWGVSRRDVNR